MSGSGGFAVSRTPSGNRLYNSPAMRRHQQLLLQQQQVEQKRHQQQRQLRSEPAAEAEARTNSDDSTLSKPSVCSASPPRPAANVTNIDRLLESNKHVVNEVAIDKIGLGKMVGPRGTAAEHGKHWQEQVQLEGEM